MQPRFDDNCNYLVNYERKLIYAHPGATIDRRQNDDASWKWLTHRGEMLNTDRFADYQITFELDVSPPLNEPIRSDTEWCAELPVTGEFSFPAEDRLTITQAQQAGKAAYQPDIKVETAYAEWRKTVTPSDVCDDFAAENYFRGGWFSEQVKHLRQSDYENFLKAKLVTAPTVGFEVAPDEINPLAHLFQRDTVRWACKLGRAALFEECGQGKTFQELEIARLVTKHKGGKAIIFTVLGAIREFIADGQKFGIPVKRVSKQDEVGDETIVVTNYDNLHNFDLSQFICVILDESSILKNFTGKIKQKLIEVCASVPYRFCGTATPAPNDHLELGNHAEFLGIMPSDEMIMRWFINDGKKAGVYRLKGHAAKDFWRWLTSWAVSISKPGDLGAEYDMPEYQLPELKIVEHSLAASAQTMDRTHADGRLLPDDSPNATTIHKVKRESLTERVAAAVEILKQIPASESVAIWCETNDESSALAKAIPIAVELVGKQDPTVKEKILADFAEGRARIIITKPSIAGFGLNWQHCCYHIDVGVSFSFEKTYQKIRRSWRYRQTKPVTVWMIYTEGEGNVMQVLKAKQKAFREMQTEMNAAMREHGLFRNGKSLELVPAPSNVERGNDWTLYLGDCVQEIKNIPDNSIDFGIHSPPFIGTYLYTDSVADMGNCADEEEFFKHYRDYLIPELYRTTRPGRLCAVHCKDLPMYQNHDGSMGLKDFPGEIVRAFEACGWQYHSRVLIWKDPVIEMQRTNNHGLLHKNFEQRAEVLRQGCPDYLVVFRKWPVEGGVSIQQKRVIGDYIGTQPPTENDIAQREGGRYSREKNYSIAVWQRYASPVWFDIDQTNVLNYTIAKDAQDDKHICPLQLDVIGRAVDLWSMPGETVFTPFAGVGSELYEPIKLGRKAIGIELKESYFKTAVKYLKELEATKQLALPGMELATPA